MTDSNENPSIQKSEDLIDHPALPEIKMCMVQLEKIDLRDYLCNDNDSSDDDLPALSCLLDTISTQKKIQKSNEELLEEQKDLAKNIQVGISSNNGIEEKLNTISLVNTDEVERVSASPPVVANEEEALKVFFVNDTLQFFNICDVTLEQCGYDSKSTDLTEYEKTMLSFKRVELERVLPSFLFSCNVYCISDIKSFIIFLLRNLSVHTDVAGVEACYDALNFILEKHPNAKTLNFSSAEIFMLLFNYGSDINRFKFLEKQKGIQKYLEEPKDKSRSKIPETWMFNLKLTLNAVVILITNCEFKLKHLCNIIIYFLWMSLDTSLLHENIFSTVRECINITLEQVPPDKWSKVMREVASAFITENFLYSQDQWKYVYHIAESVPVTSKRGLELRKYISFLALTQLGKIEFAKGSIEQSVEVNKTLNGFSLSELQSFLEKLIRYGSDATVNFASKFLNICISHLEATEEEFKELCYILKNSECVLSERVHEAKAHFVKIHARLKIRHGKINMYEIPPEDNRVVRKKIKTEIGQDVDIKNVPCTLYPLLNVKQEPIQDSMPFVMDHSSEKIISFSEFDCENDEEEMDFSDVDESDMNGSIHMNVVPDTVRTEQSNNSYITNSNESENFSTSNHCCDIRDEKYVNTSKSSNEDSIENSNNSFNNSITINAPAGETVAPLNSEKLTLQTKLLSSDDNLPSSIDFNERGCINSYAVKEKPVISSCKSSEEPTSHPLPYESSSGFVADIVDNNKELSHTNTINNLVITDSEHPLPYKSCSGLVDSGDNNKKVSHTDTINSLVILDSESEFKKDSISKDELINATSVVLTTDKQAIRTQEVVSSNSCSFFQDVSSHDETDKLSSEELSINTSELSLGNNNMDSPISGKDINESYVPLLPPSITMTPITDRGTMILPSKKKTHIPLQELSNQNSNVCSDQLKTSKDADVMFLSEEDFLQNGKKKQNERVDVETIESDGSENDLQILFCKPIPKHKSSMSTKLFRKKPKNKTEYDADDEVTIIADSLNECQTYPNLSKSQSSNLKDSSCNEFNYKNIALGREDTMLSLNIDSKDDESCNETVTNAINLPANYHGASNNNENVIEHLNLPSEQLYTSESNMTVTVNNNDQLDNKILNSHLKKSTEFTENDIFIHRDVNSSTTNNVTSDGSVPSNGQSVSVENNVLENVVKTVVVESEIALDEVPEELPGVLSSSVNKQESRMDGSHTDAEVPIKDSNIRVEDIVIINSTRAKETSLQEDGKLNTDGNLLEENTQSVKVQSSLNPSKMVNLKKKCISNTRNLLLHNHSTQHNIDKDLTLVLNDLLPSSPRLSTDDACQPPQSTPISNNVTDFNSSSTSVKEISSSSHLATEQPDLGSHTSLQSIPNQTEAEETNPVCSYSLKTNSVIDNKSENIRQPVIVSLLNDKILPVLNISEGSDKKIAQSKYKMKRKNNEFSSPTSKLLNVGNKSRPYNSKKSNDKTSTSPYQTSHLQTSASTSINKTSTSPSKSHVNVKSMKNKHSPKKYFDYQQRRSNYTSLRKQNILKETRLPVSNPLRSKHLPNDFSEPVPSSSTVEDMSSDSSGSDVVELYSDPKNYADQECILIFDSSNQIVLDSD